MLQLTPLLVRSVPGLTQLSDFDTTDVRQHTGLRGIMMEYDTIVSTSKH